MDNASGNYITSYPNPDTDGVACSIAMANMLSLNGKQVWVPVILGSISDETNYVLKYLNIPVPTIVSNLSGCNSIVLVDTHHKLQLPADFPFDKVSMVIDHHPDGDDDLFANAKIINEKIGAAATIVARIYFENKIYDKKMLSLLGFAILSNTLNFSAPSTTDADRDIYNRIASEVIIDDKSITEMFAQRSLILQNDIYSALCSDFKVFDTKSGIVGISQVEAYGLEVLVDVNQAKIALQRIASEKHLQYCLFNGVDIKSGKSIVICANEDTQRLVESVFKMPYKREPLVFNHILLRKTDFIPTLNS